MRYFGKCYSDESITHKETNENIHGPLRFFEKKERRKVMDKVHEG